MKKRVIYLFLACFSFPLLAASSDSLTSFSQGTELRASKYKVGQRILVKDNNGGWFRAIIKQVVKTGIIWKSYKIKIHFVGYSPQYDEWIKLNDENRGGRIRLWDESEQQDCPICLDTYEGNYFRVLECSHSLCFTCHQTMIQGPESAKKCHMCRSTYTKEDRK